MTVDGQTKIIGFLGATYKTSPMYAMYNRAFEVLKLQYIYVPLAATGAREAMEGMRKLGIHAVGVTIPYKTAVIPFLDELDDVAAKAGAVNVVVNHDGKLVGGNTDGIGAVAAIKEVTKLKGKKVILLGAGGAARAIACALAEQRARVVLINRTVGRAKEIAGLIGAKFGGMKDLASHICDGDILINATNIGMAPHDEKSLVDEKLLKSGLIVMDLVRDPRETKLIKEAMKLGCRVILGERMLLWQAVEKFEIYTGKKAPVAIMENAMIQGG